MNPNPSHLFIEGDPPDARARAEQAYNACIQVFGDGRLDGLWVYQHSDEFGEWITPSQLAARSFDDLIRVLSRLEELAKTATPSWHLQTEGRKPIFE